MRNTVNVLCGVVLLATVAVHASESEGWDNRCETRKLRERTDMIFWEAQFDKGEDAFVIEKRDGAEGEVSFSGGRMTVRKTNAAGYILVTAKDSFSRPVGAKLKSFADAEVSGADPLYSLAFPRILDSKKRLTACWSLDAERVFMGGGEKIAYLANTAPGVAERRFSNFIVGDGGTDLTAALVVAGAPSVTVWRRWGVEDYDAANAAWEKYRANFTTAGAGKTNFEDSVAFERRLAGDFEHSAKVVRFGGRVRFLVDGKDTPPVIYKNPYSWGQNWGDFDGRGFAREGVKVQSFQIGCARHWTNGAWNVETTMRDIRDMMRVSPDALVVLSFNASAPKEYAESHPDEIWRNPDGTPCVGKWEHMYSRHYSSANKKPYRDGCWPWVSHSSKVYLAYMKDVLGEIIARLKKEGLSKRIVGIHFCGWHDAQFAPYRPDFSAPAKEGFREFLAEKYGEAPENLELPVPGTEPFLDPEKEALAHDFNVYLHLAPFRFQEELARHAKRRFGKDIVCMHWCMGPFTGEMPGAFYLDAFLKSDVMDALVAQPSYVRRLPGNPVGSSLPLVSFTRCGKLYIDELDLRAWGEMPTYVREESMGGLGFAMDLPEWEAVNRKMAGRMIAAGHGFWYYDISGGFYNPNGIKEDIGAGVRTYADLRRGAASRWRPSASVVVDEEGMLWSNLIGQPKHPNGRAIVNGQLGLLAASGVPFDVWTYENAAQSASALAARKVVVLAGFYRIDENRRAFLGSLAKRGATLVFLAGTDGFRKNVRKEGAFPRIVAEDKTRECDFLSRFHADWMRWSLGVRGGELAISYMPPSWSFDEKPGTTVLARYADDGKPAVIRRGNAVAVGQAAGLTPRFFNRIVREAGGYVPVEKGLQVDMSGGFISVVALDNGHFDFRLPFPCKVTNLKTGRKVATDGGVLPLDLVAGEVRWYALDATRGKGGDPERVKVAAAGSSEAAKAAADYVCRGTNDQEVLQLAIDECAKDGRDLFLYDGVYMIDAFSEANDGGAPASVVMPAMQRHFAIEGQRLSQGGYFTSPSNGVVWYARSSIWDTVETNDVPAVLRGEWARNGIGSQYGSGLRIKNLSISICDAQHPARCVDLRCNDGVEVMNMRLRGMGERWMRGDSWPFYKFGPLPMPHIDSIGITMTGGSNIPIARFDNIIATGFGQAFQAGGEHVIFNNCLSSYNLYGWTFGNYRFGLPVGAADNHPIVLINCGDEQSAHLPLFVKCGDKGGRIHGLQSVTMIGMNFERVPGQTIGGKTGDNMRETIPGSWRGHIEYTMQPEWGATNGVHQALWEEDGSGSGFETRNLAHKLAGTSEERRKYYPQFGQQYFDTDVGKLLICTDPPKRKWVDAMGNAVE